MFDPDLAALAARQYGVFSAAQANELGITRSQLHRLVRTGHLSRFHPGVYGVAGTPATWRRSLKVACLAAGKGAVVSHRAAAQLWGLLGEDADLVEITVPVSRRPQLPQATVHRSSDLRPDHWLTRHHLALTNPMRTIVDLGAVVGAPQVEDALDRGLTRHLYSVAAVEWIRGEVSEHGRSGAGVLGRILDERALGRQPADGQLEPRMARLLKRAGLPPAVFHYLVRSPSGMVLAETDFAYPELRLAIEVDGFDVHGTPRQMGKDFVRQNGLVPLGWRVLRFTWLQVVRQSQMVAETIRAAIAALAA